MLILAFFMVVASFDLFAGPGFSKFRAQASAGFGEPNGLRPLVESYDPHFEACVLSDLSGREPREDFFQASQEVGDFRSSETVEPTQLILIQERGRCPGLILPPDLATSMGFEKIGTSGEVNAQEAFQLKNRRRKIKELGAGVDQENRVRLLERTLQDRRAEAVQGVESAQEPVALGLSSQVVQEMVEGRLGRKNPSLRCCAWVLNLDSKEQFDRLSEWVKKVQMRLEYPLEHPGPQEVSR